MLRGCVRLSVVCDVWTDFNSLAYHIQFLHHQLTSYQKNSFFYRTVTDWNCLPGDTVRIPWTIQGLGLCISMNCIWGTPPVGGERESRPFREEPETFISILISTTSMHLELFVMHSDAGTYAASGHSGIFNLLKFDHISKKERKDMYCG